LSVRYDKVSLLRNSPSSPCTSIPYMICHIFANRRNDIALPEELPICLRPMNLKHRLVDRHNNNNNTSTAPAAAAGAAGHSKNLYEDDHERPLLDTTETDSLDLTHMSGGGGGGGGGGGQAAPEAGEGGELVVNSPESLLSSPGRPQPVKFDFNAVDAAKGSVVEPVARNIFRIFIYVLKDLLNAGRANEKVV
jgi:hypothetical protein